MIDVTIIIPVYNASLLINRCVDSVLAQSGNVSYEVIFVDDGSTDNSIDLVLNCKCEHFKVLKQSNSGPACARNRGIRAAQGRYVTFLDADDYWEKDYLIRLAGFLNSHSECVAVSCVCKNIALGKPASYNPTSYSLIDGIETVLSEGGRERVNIPIVLDDFYYYWANNRHVGTCSTVFRTEVAKNICGQREDLRVTEDYEFWFRLASCGKWGIVPNVLYVSDGGGVTSQQGWLNKMERRWRNAPSVAEWEREIIAANPHLIDCEGYMKARGAISRDLTYCQLLSGRISLARQEALAYGKFFDKDTMGKLMNLCKNNKFTWYCLCKFLRFREEHRKV